MNKAGKEVEMAEKTAKALELRKAGVTYAEIARQIGYGDKSTARRLVVDALQDMVEAPSREVLAEEIARLDAMLVGLWPRARRGEAAAVDRVLRIMDRRAKYLGLDQPEQVQIAGDVTYKVVGIDPAVFR